MKRQKEKVFRKSLTTQITTFFRGTEMSILMFDLLQNINLRLMSGLLDNLRGGSESQTGLRCGLLMSVARKRLDR